MEKISKTYEVFNFTELKENARLKAINDTINFFIEDIPYKNLSENMKKAVDISEKMKTPWFLSEYIMEYAENEIIEMCNQYKYLKNGIIFNE